MEFGKSNDSPSLPSRLNSIELLKKNFFYLKRISLDENYKPPWNPKATEEAIEILECSDVGANNKIYFIIEQLSEDIRLHILLEGWKGERINRKNQVLPII